MTRRDVSKTKKTSLLKQNNGMKAIKQAKMLLEQSMC